MKKLECHGSKVTWESINFYSRTHYNEKVMLSVGGNNNANSGCHRLYYPRHWGLKKTLTALFSSHRRLDLQDQSKPSCDCTEVNCTRKTEGRIRRNLNVMQLNVSIAALGFFYLMNRHSLSTVFKCDLGSKRMLERRLAVMECTIGGWIRPRGTSRKDSARDSAQVK